MYPSQRRIHALPAVALGAIREILDRTRYGEPLPIDVLIAEMDQHIQRELDAMTPDERAAHIDKHGEPPYSR